ncbi:MAG: metal-dependent hydrolase [Desulfobulbaceae bacterium]|nr:MAG: metal-dependent hydrolase [Desulfobulbaceae bacterium]
MGTNRYIRLRKLLTLTVFFFLITTEQSFSLDHPPIGDKDVTIEWLGHGSFLFVATDGTRILLDPWISTNPKCPGKYRKKGGFGKVDMILWTHGHVDHFMLDDAKDLVEQYNPKIIAPWELNFFIKSEIPEANCQIFSLGNKGSTADIDGIKVTMTEAFHSAGAQLIGFEGKNKFVGEAVGYILEFRNGLKIYHAGDTGLMGDMKTIIGDFYKPHVAILPIGGVFTMGPEEAAFSCTLLRSPIVIPDHYATFPVLEQSADLFSQRMSEICPESQAIVLEPGVPLQVNRSLVFADKP